MVICTGYAQGVTLLMGVLAAMGAKRVALSGPRLARAGAGPIRRRPEMSVVSHTISETGSEAAR
jgi:hypothetical protein